MSRPPVRTEQQKLAFERSFLAAEIGAIHQQCCREALEYPGACERTTVSAGSLGIKVQQCTPEWAAFQNATHFWADWDAALAECWGVYRSVIKVIGLVGPGPRADWRSRELMLEKQLQVYGQQFEPRVWREKEKHAVQHLAEKLHRRR